MVYKIDVLKKFHKFIFSICVEVSVLLKILRHPCVLCEIFNDNFFIQTAPGNCFFKTKRMEFDFYSCGEDSL